MVDIKKAVMAFASVAFVLLGVLFGMQIMTFIFGNLGTVSGSFTVESNSIVNESGFINGTGYTLAGASDAGFSNPIIITAANSTGLIAAGNFTLNTLTGLVLNATGVEIDFINFTYTYNSDSEAKISADGVTNNSLGAILTYTEQSNTQFNTVGIAITLVILISVFLLFWTVFMSKKGVASGGGGVSNFS